MKAITGGIYKMIADLKLKNNITKVQKRKTAQKRKGEKSWEREPNVEGKKRNEWYVTQKAVTTFPSNIPLCVCFRERERELFELSFNRLLLLLLLFSVHTSFLRGPLIFSLNEETAGSTFLCKNQETEKMRRRGHIHCGIIKTMANLYTQIEKDRKFVHIKSMQENKK